MNTSRWLTTTLILGLLVGCSKTEPPKPAPAAMEPAGAGTAATTPAKPEMAKPDQAKAVVQETKPAPKPPVTPPTPPKPAGIEIPNTPDGTVMAVVQNVSENKPEVLWLALPKKYQDDVKGVISAFSGKVDKEVWDKTFVVLNKVTKLAKDKKEFILGHPLAGSGVVAANMDKINANWDGVISSIEILTGSELKTVDGLAKLDPEKFLKGTGTKWGTSFMKLAAAASDKDFAKEMEKIKKFKATVVKVEGDTATVKLENEGEEPKERVMKKVDGKWLPGDLVDGWDDAMAKAKDGIAKINLTGEQKTQAMTMLGMADGLLDGLLATKTQEDFNNAVNGAMAMLGGGAGGPGGGAPPKLEPPKSNEN